MWSRHRRRRAKVKTKPDPQRWSGRVTRESNALDLEPGVFGLDDPKAIARSLKRSADRSTRRKANPFRSAMSMLLFYANRAGKNLSKARVRKLEAAKVELRALFQDAPRTTRRLPDRTVTRGSRRC